ncbi:MAG TPA: hypothetical protein ACHBX0_01465 [Arsenophonus sp.]
MNDKLLSLTTNIDQAQLKRGLQNRHIQLIAYIGYWMHRFSTMTDIIILYTTIINP